MDAIYFDRFKELTDAIKIISMNEANDFISVEQKKVLLSDYKTKAFNLINFINLELDLPYTEHQ